LGSPQCGLVCRVDADQLGEMAGYRLAVGIVGGDGRELAPSAVGIVGLFDLGGLPDDLGDRPIGDPFAV
jgi:hypothetical protein